MINSTMTLSQNNLPTGRGKGAVGFFWFFLIVFFCLFLIVFFFFGGGGG